MRYLIEVNGQLGVVPFESVQVAFQVADFLSDGTDLDVAVVAVPQ